ncbi:MAG: glycoside hydrolase family 113 [Bacteroidia bacterium]
MKYFPWLWCLCFFACQTVESQDTNSREKMKGLSFTAPMQALDSLDMKEVQAVHADWIALMPYSYLRKDSSRLHWNSPWQYWGETRRGIIESIRLAKENKLHIMLKPHIWAMHGAFTGHLSFQKAEDWLNFEQSYREYVLDYAKIADSMQVEAFCLATELETMIAQRPLFFDSLIANIRKVYHGKLTYAANWDGYEKVHFWKQLDFIGIDAYFPLCEEKKPSTNTLKKGWKKHIAAMEKCSKTHQKPIVFTEFGYRNIDFAAQKPWESNTKFSQNDAAQAICYQAIFDCVWKQSWFAGGFVWKWYDRRNHEKGYQSTDYSPQGKAAMQIIQQNYQ